MMVYWGRRVILFISVMCTNFSYSVLLVCVDSVDSCLTVKLPPQEHCGHSTDSLLWSASYGLAMFFHTLICKDTVLYFFTNKSLRCCKEKSLFVLFVLSCNNSVIILTQCFSHCTHLNKNVFIVDNICWIIFPLGFSQSPSKKNRIIIYCLNLAENH